MPKAHYFLDWHNAFTAQFVELLFRDHAVGQANFEELSIIVGSSRAARELLIHLVQTWNGKCQDSADLSCADFIPPRILTPASIPELVYSLDSSVCADDLERILAWQGALIDNPKIANRLFTPQALTHFSLDYAEQLDNLYQEVQRAGVSFEQASELLTQKLDFPDSARWQAVAELSSHYHAKLKRPDLASSELQCAALPSAYSGTLIVAAIVEHTPAIRRALTLVQDSLIVVTYAPQSLSRYFDQFGCVDAEYWGSSEIELDQTQITVSAGISELVDQVARDACELSAQSDPNALVVGVCDGQIEQVLERAFEERGRTLHSSSGVSLHSCGLVALCNVVADYIEDDSADNLARLLRLPEVELIFAPDTNLIAAIDQIRSQTLPLRAVDAIGLMEQGSEISHRLTEIFRTRQGSSSILTACEILQTLLKEAALYDDEQLLALEALVEHLAQYAQPGLNVADYLKLIARRLSRQRVTAKQIARSFEGLGWLELLLDQSPCILLAGMHEAAVPGGVVGDEWLPESVRAVLGLTTTRERVARDSYILSGLCARAEILHIYCSRSSSSGEIPLPSQLLMRCSRERLPARVLHLSRVQPVDPDLSKPQAQRIKEPPVAPPAPTSLARISISALNAYLRDPYIFALDQIAKLKFIDDQRVELDAAQFGTLAHEVIANFSKLLQKGQVAQQDFEACLRAQLDRAVQQRFAQPILVTAALQIEFLAARLKRFAQWQRQQLAAGWRVFLIEHSLAAGELEVNSRFGTTQLTGRIDRVDYNQEDETYLIIDFKTGSTNKARAAQLKDGTWRDLQLILYSAWFSRKYPGRSVISTFVEIDKSVGAIEHENFEFDQDQQAAALDQAAGIIDSICQGDFAPSSSVRLHDPYGLLFPQDGFDLASEEERDTP